MVEKLSKTDEAKKWTPLTAAGMLLSVIGLLALDGAMQYVFLIAGAALCMVAAVKILQIKKA